MSNQTGIRVDSNGFRAWIDGREVTREQWSDYMKWHDPAFIFLDMMEARCTNCRALHEDCRCCLGCGQPDADIIGFHGYGCAL